MLLRKILLYLAIVCVVVIIVTLMLEANNIISDEQTLWVNTAAAIIGLFVSLVGYLLPIWLNDKTHEVP